jgi:beta-lactam-binding protein with PASTA domain
LRILGWEIPRIPFNISARLKRGLIMSSAVFAALVCAAVLVNYVVMPMIVRQRDLVPAPDLGGRSLVEARRVVEESGLRIRVDTERPDPTIPTGSIVRQTPGEGVDTKRGRTVAVVVSSGLDLKAVPPLVGLTARQAELDIEAAGFTVGGVAHIHSDRIERGRIVGTSPQSGSVLPAGSGIDLLVSLGPKPLEMVMPSLVGRTPEEARLVAEELGLVVRSVKYERGRSSILRDVVVVQEPVAGSRVVEGEGITLRVGKG